MDPVKVHEPIRVETVSSVGEVRTVSGWVMPLPAVMHGECNGADVLVKFDGCDPSSYGIRRAVREKEANQVAWQRVADEDGANWRASNWEAFEWVKVRTLWWRAALDAVKGLL
jgi:hypothetical protein